MFPDMKGITMTEVPGVKVPDSAMCKAVTEFVQMSSEPYLFLRR